MRGKESLRETLLSLAQRYAEIVQNFLGNNLTSVVLFGSVARGNVTPTSDIDLLVIAKELPRGAFRRRELLEPVRERLLAELDSLWARGIYTDFVEVIKTEREAQKTHLFYLDMTEEAIILYDRDNFFANILERLREKLRELKAKRKRLGRMWYWDLKPDFKPGEVIEL